MKECAVLEGRIVVSGGRIMQNLIGTKTVEVFDHINNTRISMPNMIKRRNRHSSALKNKLYTIGDFGENINESCEVFD